MEQSTKLRKSIKPTVHNNQSDSEHTFSSTTNDHIRNQDTGVMSDSPNKSVSNTRKPWIRSALLLLATLAVLSFSLFFLSTRLDMFNRNVLSESFDPTSQFENIETESPSVEVHPSRIIAVGDLHGDLAQALKTLKMARIMNDNEEWIAGSSIFVQTGDVVDRGPDTIKLYKMLYDLKVQAEEHGGQVIQLLGNHEVMNMAEDLRYVTEGDYSSFGGHENRRKAFDKDGWPGNYLRTLNITTWVNGTVFFHGGAHPQWAKLGIDGMNLRAHNGLIGRSAGEIQQVPIFGGSGPLWFRGYAEDQEKSICKQLDKALADMNAVRMVVGHTPQLDGSVLRRCNGKLYVIDVGISRVYGGNSAALEIIGDHVYALYPGKKPQLLAPT
ncbi:hypothetical protein BDV3_004772 [Batrachochytrium dendrobatidis]|uniref:Calcineurin-like phosphoesterase domain-containing protein n=2 Tax=Batrachochytrium dendrobatidis TaxID=109871 RepID=A0A177WKA5_BATDL|nr:hypothetical protein BDEG_23989 [Batrachochytrium dendrobatidis JEL423]